MHTDIQNHEWLQKLPQGLRPYFVLGRFDRPIGVWLLLLPGWWSIALASPTVFAHWDLYLLFAVGAVVMRAAGCVLNDLWDHELDKQVGRTKMRPLAAGTLNKKQAGLFLILLLLVGLVILLQMNVLTIVLGLISLPLIVVYPLMKRITWWPQAFLGLTFNFGALMGWGAVTGELAFPALLLYGGAIFWTLGYDTIYAHQDKEDDALIGVKSTALRLGSRSRVAVMIFYTLQILAWTGALGLEQGWAGILCLLPVAAHLAWQIRSWEPDDPQSCLRVFQSSRDAGLLFLGALLLVAWI